MIKNNEQFDFPWEKYQMPLASSKYFKHIFKCKQCSTFNEKFYEDQEVLLRF